MEKMKEDIPEDSASSPPVEWFGKEEVEFGGAEENISLLNVWPKGDAESGSSRRNSNGSDFPPLPQPPSPQDPLTILLGQHENFVYKSVKKFGFHGRVMIVQICDANGDVIMSTVMDPGTTIRRHSQYSNENRFPTTSSVTTFTTPDGIMLMTSKETGNSQTVTSGSKVLGIVEGVGLFATTLQVTNAMGQMLFETHKRDCGGDHPGIFVFELNGEEIARAGPGMGGDEVSSDFGFAISPGCRPLDPNTRALLIATAYYIYYLHFAENFLGLKGAKGVERAMCVCFIATSVGMVLFVVLVVAFIVRL